MPPSPTGPPDGRLLAEALADRLLRHHPVMGAVPGGAVVAEVALVPGAELDLVTVARAPVPGFPELPPLATLASGGVRVLNPDVIAAPGIDQEAWGGETAQAAAR